MIDLTGKRFGKLTVIKKLDKVKNGSTVWLCQCDCGNQKEATTKDLNGNRVTSCGCLKGNHSYLVGKRFGKLIVIADSGEKQGTAKMWLCQCDCGKTIKVRTDSLTSGRTTSCGCNLCRQSKIKALNDSKCIKDHTSMIYFKGTVRKNNKIGVNGVTILKNGLYRAYIGYKNKTYVLYQGRDLNRAVEARMEADELIQTGRFDEWISTEKRRKGN